MNKINAYLNKLCFISLLFSLQNAFAGNFNIVPITEVALPTTITSGQTVVAYFTVTNMNSSASLNGYQIAGLPSTVTQNTTAPNYYTSASLCSNPISLAPNASCLLQLDIKGPVSGYFALCKGNSCTRSAVPLHVLTTPMPTTPTFAYVTQASGSTLVSVCEVNQSTGLLASCHTAGGGSELSGALVPQGITIDAAGATAYINTYASPYGLYQCPIYANTGMFGACTQSIITSPAYNSYYGLLTLNTNDTVAFINDSTGPAVLACPVLSHTIQSVCSNTGATNLSGELTGISLNAANTVSYVGSYANYITTCTVSSNTFSNCGKKTGDGVTTFAEAIDVALNSAGTIVYITDNDTGDVYGCDVTGMSTGSSTFSACFTATHLSPQPWGIAINQSNSFAYLTDYDSTVSTCPILEDGTFSACIANSSFTEPVDIALFY
jgi:hypothetical protein